MRGARPPRHAASRGPGVLVWLCAFLVLPALAHRADAEQDETALAAAARPSVVRLRWRHERFGDLTSERNAVVVHPDGLLLMAGPPPSRRGTLSARLADGSEHRARIVASDTKTALTLLRVPVSGLRPLTLRVEPEQAPHPPPAAASFRPRELYLPPIGLRVVMVTGDGAVAVGAVRSRARYGSVTHPDSRETTPTVGLLGAALAAVDADAGSPLLDDEGRLVGLMVGRQTRTDRARERAARARGLALRPEPVEIVAVPAAVVAIVRPLLETMGRVPRAALGVTTEPIDDVLRGHLGIEGGAHVVRHLQAKGPAAAAGLRVHDVIVALNGRALPSERTLHDLLLPFRPRMPLKLGVVRGRARVEVTLVLGER